LFPTAKPFYSRGALRYVEASSLSRPCRATLSPLKNSKFGIIETVCGSGNLA
jgi:hypothetical protein